MKLINLSFLLMLIFGEVVRTYLNPPAADYRPQQNDLRSVLATRLMLQYDLNQAKLTFCAIHDPDLFISAAGDRLC